MNITQKKYAIARVGTILMKQIVALDDLDTKTNKAYKDSLKVPLPKVLAAIKSGKVTPFPAKQLAERMCGHSLSSIYDLSPLHKAVDDLGRLEYNISVKFPPMGGDRYSCSKSCYFQSTVDGMVALRDKFQELSDDIMLGNDETAMKAIRSAESLT